MMTYMCQQTPKMVNRMFMAYMLLLLSNMTLSWDNLIAQVFNIQVITVKLEQLFVFL